MKYILSVLAGFVALGALPSVVMAPPYYKAARAEAPASATTTKKIIEDDTLCSCMNYLWEQGIKVRGDAIDLPHNTPLSEVKAGDVLLTRYGDIGHASVIHEIRNDGLLISEYNYEPCAKTTRLIPYDDKAIHGFYRHE